MEATAAAACGVALQLQTPSQKEWRVFFFKEKEWRVVAEHHHLHS